jgi:hypothetical protein
MNKIEFKQKYKKCAICDEDNYALLDVHRIHHGKEYSEGNCITLCCKCHRLHHANQIKIISKNQSTLGMVLIFEKDDEENIKII